MNGDYSWSTAEELKRREDMLRAVNEMALHKTLLKLSVSWPKLKVIKPTEGRLN